MYFRFTPQSCLEGCKLISFNLRYNSWPIIWDIEVTCDFAWQSLHLHESTLLYGALCLMSYSNTHFCIYSSISKINIISLGINHNIGKVWMESSIWVIVRPSLVGLGSKLACSTWGGWDPSQEMIYLLFFQGPNHLGGLFIGHKIANGGWKHSRMVWCYRVHTSLLVTLINLPKETT